MTPQLPDICRAHHGGNEQSEAANASVHASKQAMRERILHLLAERSMTCDELERATGWPHQSVSARLAELRLYGKVRRNGQRATRSGRMAAVLEVTISNKGD